MKLTKNFDLEEFTKSPTADKYHINNSIPEKYIDNIKVLADFLQIIRDMWKEPIIINSGYRSKALNTKIKGAANSDHLYGCAVDITANEKYKNKDLFNLVCYLAKEGIIRTRQIIDEKNYSWIHFSINNEYNTYRDNQILHLK